MPPLNKLAKDTDFDFVLYGQEINQSKDTDFDFVLYGQEINQSCDARLEQALKLGTRRREQKTCPFNNL
jgi:predicted nucleotidyltransferase